MAERFGSTTKSGLIAGLGGALGCAVLIGLQAGSHEPVSQAPPEPPRPATASGHGLTLTSVSVDLPDDDAQYPPGPNASVINGNCTACHSATMALYQPRLSPDQWRAEVEKMRQTYKASVDEANVPKIVGYLSAMSAKLAPSAQPGVAKDPTGKLSDVRAASG